MSELLSSSNAENFLDANVSEIASNLDSGICIIDRNSSAVISSNFAFDTILSILNNPNFTQNINLVVTNSTAPEYLYQEITNQEGATFSVSYFNFPNRSLISISQVPPFEELESVHPIIKACFGLRTMLTSYEPILSIWNQIREQLAGTNEDLITNRLLIFNFFRHFVFLPFEESVDGLHSLKDFAPYITSNGLSLDMRLRIVRDLYSVNHDVANILGRNITNFRLLEMALGPEEDITNLSPKMMSNILKSLALPNAILANALIQIDRYAYLGQGLTEVIKSEANVAQLIEDITRIFEPEANSKDLGLHVKTSSKLNNRTVYVDSRQVRNILDNIIGNAIRHTESGSVTVGAKIKVEGTQEVLVLTITDTGPGIPKHLQASIFERAVSGSGSTGLGLHTALIQARNHNGDITFKTSSKGTQFTINIPIIY